MKAAFGNGWKWLLGIFMSLLGFTGCGKLGIFRTEYGCPSADFKLVGDVKDAKGKIIDVKVSYTEGYAEQMLRYSKEFKTLPLINN